MSRVRFLPVAKAAVAQWQSDGEKLVPIIPAAIVTNAAQANVCRFVLRKTGMVERGDTSRHEAGSETPQLRSFVPPG
ncbi:MAG: hypothetical protein WA715_02545, partial [Candidatus Acidiferrum sp.]